MLCDQETTENNDPQQVAGWEEAPKEMTTSSCAFSAFLLSLHLHAMELNEQVATSMTLAVT